MLKHRNKRQLHGRGQDNGDCWLRAENGNYFREQQITTVQPNEWMNEWMNEWDGRIIQPNPIQSKPFLLTGRTFLTSKTVNSPYAEISTLGRGGDNKIANANANPPQTTPALTN